MRAAEKIITRQPVSRRFDRDGGSHGDEHRRRTVLVAAGRPAPAALLSSQAVRLLPALHGCYAGASYRMTGSRTRGWRA